MERERKGGLLLAIFKMPALSGLTFVISVFSVKEIISSFSLWRSIKCSHGKLQVQHISWKNAQKLYNLLLNQLSTSCLVVQNKAILTWLKGMSNEVTKKVHCPDKHSLSDLVLCTSALRLCNTYSKQYPTHIQQHTEDI